MVYTHLVIKSGVFWRLVGLCLMAGCFFAVPCFAQSLFPRAYLITPNYSNAITISYSLNDGNIVFDPALPITDGRGRLSIPSFSFYHSFHLFDRSTNILVSVPYATGNFKATVLGQPTEVHRSGLMNSLFRISINLLGGRAMDLKEFATWRQKTLVGVSFTVLAPTGQYDSTKLINLGTNRWGFKPEIGLSHRWNNWIFDAYGGLWFFTKNNKFFSENQFTSRINTLTQATVLATEAHISYDLKPGWWASFDVNYWYGGRTSINGKENATSLQANSRFGGTGAVRISRRQSLKVSFSRGAIIRIGGNYNILSLAWQYSWLGKLIQ